MEHMLFIPINPTLVALNAFNALGQCCYHENRTSAAEHAKRTHELIARVTELCMSLCPLIETTPHNAIYRVMSPIQFIVTLNGQKTYL